MTKIKKVRQGNHTTLDNTILEDTSLSWKAKGVFVYLWGRPDDWDFYETEVAKHATDGRDSLRTALKELEKRGYLKRTRQRNSKGQLTANEWELYEIPPMLDFRMLDNATILNTNYTKHMITTYGKVVGSELINKLDLLSYTDDRQKLDTVNVVIRFKDKLNSDLLLYGIKRTRDNQIAGKKIKNVAGYLTNVYKHWIEAGITEVAEAKAESEARYREDVDKEVYRDMYEAGYTDIADYKEAYGG